MDLVTGAMGNLAPKLLQLLGDEYKLHKGLREKVESVSEELKHVHALLSKVAEVPWDQLDEQVKIWADQLREKSYDMEDVLDTFLVRVEGPVRPDKENKLKRCLKKMGNLFSKGKVRHDIAGAIEDIEKELKMVNERRATYKLDDVVSKPAAPSTIDPRIVAMRSEVMKLIGIDKSSGELSKMLSLMGKDSNGKIKIVSVVGVGGLGKTTLAKAVYDKLKPMFGCGAFVPVGRDRDVKRVLRDILIGLDKEKYMNVKYDILDGGQLIDELQDFLRSKRYFIVIDDVWSTKTWETIKTAFVENDSGSRVIMTTRKLEVASMAEEVYYLQPLSYDDSKMLLYTRLYGGEDKCPANHPAEASEKILKKCGGIPLAIITMASMLVGKSTEDWYVVCNSRGFYRGNEGQQVRDTEWILSLSYYDLPLNLRTCLLYLSVYPEDCAIDKNSLIWKWIAEGFVEMKTGTSLFERGEEYFYQLINSSLIQADEASEGTGITRYCLVHDMVLDLIRGLSEKVNFVTISNDFGEGTLQRNKQVRRLAHHHRSMKQTHQEDDDRGVAKLRSLVVYRCKIGSWFLHPSFELLRVLAIEMCEYEEGLQGLRHLGNLLHLRYLGIQGKFGRYELPEEIGKLKFLQILDLEHSDVELLPSGVCQLTQLLCLRGGLDTSLPDGFLKKVTLLEELHISINKLDDDESKRQFMKDLGNLRQVRELTILGQLRGRMVLQSDLLKSLGNLRKLQHLKLADFNSRYEDYTCEWVEWEDKVMLPRHLQVLDLLAVPFRRPPSCISPMHLQNLCELELLVESMDEAGLRALGGLPQLRFLGLRARPPSTGSRENTVASINIISGDGFLFQKLRYCYLCGWMVQLVLNKNDSMAASVSVSFWNGNGAAPFDSRAKQQAVCTTSSVEAVVPPPVSVMPNLQELYLEVLVRALYKDGNCGCDNLGLELLPSLAIVEVGVDCEGATVDDVDKAEAELRNAAKVHPNKLILDIHKLNKSQIMAQSTDQGGEEDCTKLSSLLGDMTIV